MRSQQRLLGPLTTLAVVWILSWSIATLLGNNLPVNRTSSVATGLILSAAVLVIGGPIIGLFLASAQYRRITRDPAIPSLLQTLRTDAAARRKYARLLTIISFVIGVSLLALGITMLVPAAWLAGGGDRPLSAQNPPRPGILYFTIGMAAAGALLVLASGVVGFILLLTR
jgi:hypothetical protein